MSRGQGLSRGDTSARSSGALAAGSRGPAPSATLPKHGDVIGGKYQVVRTLGEGGMAVVFEALHLRLRQRLALKVLRPDISDFVEVLERFEREARATAQLRSIHTARIVDVETLPDGLPYIVMEYLEGIDLDAALHATGPMPVEQAVDIVTQVTGAMIEAHECGIIHRDLKPSNLFVCRHRAEDKPLIKVLDFGISRSEDEGSARITQAHAYFGTPCYAAPEQLRSAGDADKRSDVWSLGIILFELLTGRPPFTGSVTSVIAKVLSDPIPWPLDLRPDMSRDLARVVLRALHRDPAQRFQNMREFADALAPFGPRDSGAGLARPKGRLGEILVADGVLTAKNLDRALDEQRRTGVLLGRVLLDMGLVARDDLLAALAKQQGIQSPVGEAVTERPSGGKSQTPTRRNPWLRRALIAAVVALPLGVLAALAARGSLGGRPVAPQSSAAETAVPAYVPQ